MKSDYDVAVVGGGASGMTAAIAAARAGCRVCLLEALPRVGKKLLATGNGRCNISNRAAGVEHCRCQGLYIVPGRNGVLTETFAAVPPRAVWDFLESIGISLSHEDEGRMYPKSGQASSVLDMLRCELERLGVTTLCGFEVTSVRRKGDSFTLRSADGSVAARRVVMANGSKASPQLGGTDSGIRLMCAMGHTSTATRPSLVPLRCSAPVLRSLKGVRVRCEVSLIRKGKELYSDFGEVQFADGMLSGIVIFQLSARLAAAGGGEAQVVLNLLPELAEGDNLLMLKKRRSDLPHLTLENFLGGVFNKKIAVALMKQTVDLPLTERAERLTDRQLEQLADNIKAWSFTVTESAGWQQAQCMSGGIRLDEFGDDLQSRIMPGLFACGELLDCDCDCGGYNLHWAWTSGLAAGAAAAKSLQREQY